MHRIATVFLYSVLLNALLPCYASAAGDKLDLPGQYSLGDRTLALNGAGIRSKFFIKIYVGALYLEQTTGDAQQVLDDSGPKSMQMLMLHDEVAAQKIAAAWREGFEANLSKPELQTLAERLDQFNALFPDLHKGDHVKMDYAPGSGTRLSVNDKALGLIPGCDFFTALLRVWIGQQPADKALKNGLLGR